MFAHWNRMAKQLDGKGNHHRGEEGRPDPDSNPGPAPGASQNAVLPVKIEAAISAPRPRRRELREVMTRATPARRGGTGRCANDNRPARPRACATAFSKNGGNLATTGSVAFQFKRMGVFRLKPEGHRQDELERTDRPWPRGIRRKHRRESRSSWRAACSRTSHAAEAPREPRHHAGSRPTGIHLPDADRAARAQATEVLEVIGQLEQDEDVQKVYHTLA